MSSPDSNLTLGGSLTSSAGNDNYAPLVAVYPIHHHETTSQQQPQQQQLSPSFHGRYEPQAVRIMSALIGAAINSIVVTPLDVIKTRIQSELPNASPEAHEFRGTWQALRKIARTDGPQALWRGLTPTLVMSVPATVIYYVNYENMRDSLSSRLSSYAPLVAGAGSRLVSVAVISPIELLRTRMQANVANTETLTGALRDLKSVVQEQGVRSLWRGFTPTLWRDVPFSGIYWTSYEFLRQRLKVKNNNWPIPLTVCVWDEQSCAHESSRSCAVHNPTVNGSRGDKMSKFERLRNEFVVSFICGAASGMLAATLTTPFDVAKTLRQVYIPHKVSNATSDSSLSSLGASASYSRISSSSSSNIPIPPINNTRTTSAPRITPSSLPPQIQSPVPNSTVDILRYVYKTEGISGLFKGLTARIAKVAPSCAIMISSYELGKLYLSSSREEE